MVNTFFLRKTHWTLLSLCLAGALLTLAFAPFHQVWLAFFCPAFLFYCWQNTSLKKRLLYAFVFNISFFAVGASWVFVSIHVFGNTSLLLALLITLLFIALLAAIASISSLFSGQVTLGPSWVFTSLRIAAAWTLAEWLRSSIFTGFPWLLLGVSQTDMPLSAFIPLIGSAGVSFLVAWQAALLSLLSRATWKKIMLFILLGWLMALILSPIQWTQRIERPFTVALIQGNIAQEDKWQPEKLGLILKKYQTLTNKHWANLILWPEAAVPNWQDLSAPFLNTVNEQGHQHGAGIILGIPIVQKNPLRFYNGAIALGLGEGTYVKRHLVPFGEYLPFDRWLRGLINFFNLPMSNFSSGKNSQALLSLQGIPISVVLCYEIAYGDLFFYDLPQAQLIVNLSDDAWFGHSFAQPQQLQIAQARAQEMGRYVLTATNNGLTAIITPQGRLQALAPAFTTTVLTDRVYPYTGGTPYLKFGYFFVYLLWLLLAIIIFLKNLKRFFYS